MSLVEVAKIDLNSPKKEKKEQSGYIPSHMWYPSRKIAVPAKAIRTRSKTNKQSPSKAGNVLIEKLELANNMIK